MPGFIPRVINSIFDSRLNGTKQGNGARATARGELAQSSTRLTTPGQAQKRTIVLSRRLVNIAVMTEIFVNAVSERVFVDAFSSYYFVAKFYGRSVAGTDVGASMSIEIEGICDKNTIDGVGPAVMTPLAKTVKGQTAPALAWDVDANVLGENMTFSAQGDATNTVQWVCVVEMVEARD